MVSAAGIIAHTPSCPRKFFKTVRSIYLEIYRYDNDDNDDNNDIKHRDQESSESSCGDSFHFRKRMDKDNRV